MSNEITQWSNDMRCLYNQVSTGEVTLEKAETLANICGKALKAEALMFAREVFEDNQKRKVGIGYRPKDDSVVSTQ